MRFGSTNTENGRVCENCNSANVKAADFCNVCGNPLTEEAIRVYEERIKQKQLEVVSEMVAISKCQETMMAAKKVLEDIEG